MGSPEFLALLESVENFRAILADSDPVLWADVIQSLDEAIDAAKRPDWVNKVNQIIETNTKEPTVDITNVRYDPDVY